MTSVSRSGADYYDVHLGFWTNWSHGRVEGSTLTVSRTHGNLLVAFVALFVAASGKSLWRILCFLLHRYLSSPVPEDGLYHQRQAILRNSETPEEGAWRLLQLLWVWRSKARRPFVRLIPVSLFAVILAIAFVVGGIFSSQITSDQGSEVLIKGTNCGTISLVDNAIAVSDILQPYLAHKATAHSNYALQCYTNATNSEDCNLYVKPNLRTTVRRDAKCPFASDMCKSQTNNIIVDSGFIDSHADLGVNAPPDERFQMRYVYQCAPIVSTNFKKVVKNEGNATRPDVVQYFYGNLSYSLPNASDYTGFTYEVFRNFTNLDLPAYSSPGSARPEFQLGTVIYFGGDDTVVRGEDITEFSPIPQLERADADTAMFFLTTQGLGFTHEVDDPWYSAHEKWLVPLTAGEGEKVERHLYLTDEPASALACAQQLQFCNPNKPNGEQCEPLRGFNANAKRVGGLWSKKQLATIDWVTNIMYEGFYSINNMVAFIGQSLLVGRYNALYGLVGPLPDNLWQTEVEHMIGASLSSLQGAFVNAANGPSTKDMEQFIAPPKTPEGKKMCKNQKILSTRFSSFSVLALLVVFGLGSFLIALDLSLEPTINFYHSWRAQEGKLPQHHYTGSTHARLEWRATSVLQLQRMAHASVGSGTWFKTADETPVTLPFEKLGLLDVSDEKCPVYRGLPTVEEVTEEDNPPHTIRRQDSDLSDGTLEDGNPSLKQKASKSFKEKASEPQMDLSRQETRHSDGSSESDPSVWGRQSKKWLRRADTGMSDMTLTSDGPPLPEKSKKRAIDVEDEERR